jgi:hypothetical protein
MSCVALKKATIAARHDYGLYLTFGLPPSHRDIDMSKHDLRL